MDFPVLEDMICHHLDALRYFSGEEPTSVYTEAWNPAWSQFSGKASNNVLIAMSNNVHVNYFGTWTARGQLNDYDGLMQIMGSEGSLNLLDRTTLKLFPNTSADTYPNAEPQTLPILPLSHREIEGVVAAFLRALDDGTQPPCNIDDNLRTFALNCAVLQSCKEERKITLTKEVYREVFE